MSLIDRISVVAFDCFGTLVLNGEEEWKQAFVRVIEEQQLAVEVDVLWREWRKSEVGFRKTRTNMEDLSSSPPFRSYWTAWRDAFVDAFEALRLSADAETAATRCVEEHGKRPAFPEADEALNALRANLPLTILSNADDRFLHGTLAHNGWRFDTVLSSEQAQAYKPDPRIFRAFSTLVRQPPERVLYVGDSAYDDAHGAKLAGMETVLVVRDGDPRAADAPGRTPPPSATHLLPPDHVVKRLTDLGPLIEGD